MNEETIQIAMNIITWAGTARSEYLHAIELAKQYQFDEATKMLESGDFNYEKAHAFHYESIAKEASGEAQEMTLLLIHAEDQLMTTETFKILSREFYDLYKRIKGDE